MEFKIELQDPSGNVYRSFHSQFGTEATVYHLTEEVKSTFKISQKHQELFLEDGQNVVAFSEDSLQSVGLTHRSRVIVKHALFPTWLIIMERELEFQQASEEDMKKKIHEDANRLIEHLVQADFFVTFPSLGTRRFAIEKKFCTQFDRKLEQIKNSCRSHFTKIFGDKAKVYFGSKEDGSRAGCICTVDDNGSISKFFVKTHHGAGDKSSNTRYDIDLKELFVYRFLEDLRMGAQVQFINNESFSKWILYIASREIPGFRTLEFVELTQPDGLKEYTKSVTEMLFVFTVLMLGDLHSANIGFDCALKPHIVDFFVMGKLLTSVHDLLDSVRMTKTFNMNLESFERRLEISMEFLKTSNFADIFEKSLTSFIQKEKKMLDKHLLFFHHSQKTDDLKDYAENVRKNIKIFMDYAETIGN